MLKTALSTGGALNALTGYAQFILSGELNGTKVPLDHRNGAVADAHNNAIWMTAADAMQAAETQGKHVSFVFTEADPFYFLDIDKCLEPSGSWSKLAMTLVSSLPGAAVEVSQSGQGLHIFGRSGRFDHSCKNVPLGIEFYTEKRFVQLTGNGVVGDANVDNTSEAYAMASVYFKPKTLTTAESWTQEPIESYGPEIADPDVITAGKKASSAKSKFGNAASFKDLWDKDVEKLAVVFPSSTGKEYDGSSADMAMTMHLMFFTGGNCEQTERIMRSSKLARDKWDAHPEYLKQLTISRGHSMWVGDGCKTYTVPAMKTVPEQKPLPETTVGGGLTLGAGFEYYHIGFPGIKGNGKPKGTYENFAIVMEYFKVMARYNLMSKECEVIVPGVKFPVDNERNNLLSVIASLCVQVEFPTENIERYIGLYASQRTYHPVQDWINSKPWDKQDRLQALLHSLDPASPEVTLMLLRKWLISCVIGAYDINGVDAAGILVLQGEQNVGKTRWFLSLTNFNESIAKQGAILNPTDRDSVKQVVSYWLVELGELDATFRRSDISALKGFLTKKYDEFRAPYARSESRFPRRTVFFASVNPKEYLFDESGNRRYWTIGVGSKLTANHGIDMQQLWAQIKVLWESKTCPHWLNPQEVIMLNSINDAYEASAVEIDLILSRYDLTGVRDRLMTTSEILIELGMDPTRSSTRMASPKIAKALGVSGTTKSNGRKVFRMPRQIIRSAKQ